MENNKGSLKNINGLIDVLELDNSLNIDIKYASTHNFMGKAIYPVEKLVLRVETAYKLISANEEFKKMGYFLKIFDGYRPLSAQKIMWDTLPDENFVAPLPRGSVHNRGAAVDVTITDKNGIEVEMPCEFDEFSEKAWITYKDASGTTIRNREYLAEIMEKNGFKRIETEWWHFSDTDYLKYPLQDINLEDF
jgi:zinc D-Ala-D-Ala dipeptidase